MIHSNLTTESQNWEFKHPHFRRGAVEDLKNIKRKSAKSRHHLQHRPPLSAYPNEGDEYLYGPMYKHILEMEERLHNMIKAYEVLHVQTTSLKSLLSGQQKVNFKFFVTLILFFINNICIIFRVGFVDINNQTITCNSIHSFFFLSFTLVNSIYF